MYCHYIGWCIGKCSLYRGVLYSECPFSEAPLHTKSPCIFWCLITESLLDWFHLNYTWYCGYILYTQKPALRGEFSVCKLKQHRQMRQVEPLDDHYHDYDTTSRRMAGEECQDSDSDTPVSTDKHTPATKGSVVWY